ncbi:hypothetical protein vseg_013296 [Gypsophila vaccaria]
MEEDRSKVDDLRGSPMSVDNLEELIDENHAIVSSSVGPEYYVSNLSFVDKDQFEPGCSILMHNKEWKGCGSNAQVIPLWFLKVAMMRLLDNFLVKPEMVFVSPPD